MNFWAKGGISLSTTQFIACSCFYPYFFLGIIFIRHTVVLMALLYLWHLLIATPQSQSKTLNSAQIIQLQILLPLSPVLVFPANPAGYSWQNHRVSASYQLLPTLGTVSDFMLNVHKKAMKFHTPPSGSSRTIHPENSTGYAKDWVWKYWQSCRAGRESWHLF